MAMLMSRNASTVQRILSDELFGKIKLLSVFIAFMIDGSTNVGSYRKVYVMRRQTILA